MRILTWKNLTSILLTSALLCPASAEERSPGAFSATVVEENQQVAGGRVAPSRTTNSPATGRTSKSKALSITPRSDGDKKNKSPLRFGPGRRSVKAVLGSLAVVLGCFFLLAWFLKRSRGTGQQLLPPRAIEVLGRLPLGGRQQLQLVRVGGKLILINVTASGAETLTEITDPHEVEQLAAVCQAGRPNSISASFRQVLDQFGNERASGFLDTETPAGQAARNA